ncbi:transglutaminase domain-containing protein [Butyrivibrio sp. MC2021]|uniref:transglutaminase domain-containing protein n=1 Tax=Butyrivibrio sp. MC2021 TaxID=1408306 RepID=UPI00047E5789|nr:transglutaminase domain-containing protein [Butyrivibrio sp. MC2021]
MRKSYSKRLLSAGLAILTAVTMFPTTSKAMELTEATEEASVEASEAVLEDYDEEPAEETEEILIRDEESQEPGEDSTTEEEILIEEENPEDPAKEALEFYVAPGYEGTYTEDDVRYFFENEYELTEAAQEAADNDGAEFTASASDVKEAMKRRETSYSYTDSSFNPKGLVQQALVDSNETDPTGGDYIKGNLIGYNASGKGYGSTWNITITFMYASYSNPANEEKQVNSKVADIKKDLDLTNSSLSDYEKVKRIDDYLRKTITYTDDNTYGCHGTYAALVRGKCVCQGYSTAFLRLTREAGVASKYIVGMKINHAWNIVKVRNGTDPERPWYNNDTTWERFLENDIEFLDHPRDKEYNTAAFQKKHPISLYNWGMTTAGLEKENKEYSFNSIDGEPMLSTVDVDSGIPKIMLFYHYGESNTSKYPAQMLKSLEKHKVLKNKKIEVYAIDVNSDADAVKKYIKANNFGSSIRFASFNQDSTEAFKYYGGYYSPFVVMVDEYNVVQFANSYAGEFITETFANYVWDTFMYYLVADWDHTAVIKSITLDKSTANLNNGDSDILTVTYNPEKTCDDKTVTWTSSDETVVKVEATGLNTARITAVGSGVATVTAKCMSKTATCRVTTFTPITGVTVIPEDQEIYLGESTTFNAVVSPKKSDVKGGYSWNAEDPEAVSLQLSSSGDSVTVTGKKVGTTKISVEVDGFTADRQITILSADIKLDYQGGTKLDTDPDSIFGIYGLTIGKLPEPSYEGHVFLGWYTGKDCTGNKVSESTLLTRSVMGDDFILYAGYKEAVAGEFTILPIEDLTYTGKAVKPAVRVFLGDKLLTQGKDYTIKYKNNKLAYALSAGDKGFTESLAPTVTVKGKGNFSGTTTASFRILPKSLSDSDVTVDNAGLYLTANGKIQHAAPVVKFGKKALKAGKDFEYAYPDSESGDYLKAGQNTVVIKAIEGGNFAGTISLVQTIARNDLSPISKCKVTVGKSYEYTGKEIIPEVVVKSGKIILTEGRDYKLIHRDNLEIGTAFVTVTGIGGFTGSKTLSYKITGISLSKADITLSQSSFTYDGTAHKPAVTVRASKGAGSVLTEGTDYELTYLNNIAKGKAIVMVSGLGKYSGFSKKTYTITAASLEKAVVSFKKGGDKGVEPYVKGGVIPEFTVTLGENELTEGIDYTYKVTGNDQLFTYSGDDKKAPTVTITGKGNYSGKKKAFFSIVAAKIQARIGVLVYADDVVYNPKPGKWKSPVNIYDISGKKLVAGKDYDKNIKYTRCDPDTGADTGIEITDSEAPAPGAKIMATVTGINAYSGTLIHADYGVYDSKKHIGKDITFKVADQVYTGDAVTISKDDITFTAKNKEGFDKDSFDIMDFTYTKNSSKGTASVILWGNPEKGFGGMKVVTFKIVPRPVR